MTELLCYTCGKPFGSNVLHVNSEGEDVCADCCDVCHEEDKHLPVAICQYGGYTWTIPELEQMPTGEAQL